MRAWRASSAAVRTSEAAEGCLIEALSEGEMASRGLRTRRKQPTSTEIRIAADARRILWRAARRLDLTRPETRIRCQEPGH